MDCFEKIKEKLENAAYNHADYGTDMAIDRETAIAIVEDIQGEHCNLLDEIISYLKNMNFGGEYDCATNNYVDLFKEYGIDDGFFEICECVGDSVISKGDLEEFLKDYYKAVIESVCKVIETFKTEQ